MQKEPFIALDSNISSNKFLPIINNFKENFKMHGNFEVSDFYEMLNNIIVSS